MVSHPFSLLCFLLNILIAVFTIESVPCGKLSSSLEDSINDRTTKIPWAAYIMVNRGVFQNQSFQLRFPEFPGILISPSLVLFSANYLYTKKRGLEILKPFSLYNVAVGTTEFGRNANGTQVIPVSHISVHKGFKRTDGWYDTSNDFALAHLTSEIPISDTVQPVCLPSFEELQRVVGNPGFNHLLLYGWNRRQLSQLSGLRLEVMDHKYCQNFWDYSKIPPGWPYINRYCAGVFQSNQKDFCVNKDIGTFFQDNGSYFFGGQVNNYFSNNGLCTKGSTHFVWSLTNETLQWIENNKLCGPNNFTCFSDGNCISLASVCNGKDDCADSLDEQESYCNNPLECNEDELRCSKYGTCIPKSKRNDGIEDCLLGDDESETISRIPAYLIILITVGCVFVVALIVTVYYCWYQVQNLQKKVRDLTDDEVKEFLNGATSDAISKIKNNLIDNIYRKSINFYPDYTNHSLLMQPWNKDFEVSFDQLDIGEEIGSGVFGIIYKARLCSKNQNNSSLWDAEVAVKTPISNLGVEQFKAFLREIKITANFGKHENIVSFMGACTQEIKKCRAHLVVEYCSNGNLLCLLRKQSKENMLTDNTITHTYQNCTSQVLDYKVTMLDLLKWSQQIASGMAYLGQKNIIHGDLAARNILLTDSFIAKISDFGLSRELKDTSVYVKTSSELEPWKWLALESLTSNIFSHKSDVWSYGVTLWEMFSLGENPYGEIIWGEGFFMELQKGARLCRPQFASKEMYDLLLTTWNADPDKRPLFQDIEQRLAMF